MSERGGAVVDFTLVGIPLVFVLISTFEMARGMWIYHTLAHAVTEGARFASVRGRGCTVPPNACGGTVGQVAQAVARAGVGLIPDDLDVTLTSAAGSLPCSPLRSCLADSTAWPPAGNNTAGSEIGIRATYPFRSALAMFWPGAGRGRVFGAIEFGAESRERIHF